MPKDCDAAADLGGAPSAIARALHADADRKLRATRYARAWPACEELLLSAPAWWCGHAVAARVLLEWGKGTADEGERIERLERAVARFDEAKVLMDRGGVAAADGDHVELLNDRGVALYELGNYDAASAAFSDTLAARPGHARALCNLALVHWSCGRERLALDNFDRSIAADNTDPHAYNNRGALRLEVVGGADGASLALPDLHAALLLDPTYETAMRNRDQALEILAEPRPLSPVAEPEALVCVFRGRRRMRDEHGE